MSFDSIDGFFGWPLFRDNIIRIDADRQLLTTIDEVPAEARTWTSLRLHRKSSLLSLEIPGPHEGGTIFIDTGSDSGVSLSPARWSEWTNAHPNRPKTLRGSYSPRSGLVFGEESWSQQLSLGPLTLTDVPVTQSSDGDMSGISEYAATLGLAALRRLEIIVDGKKGVAYVRSRNGPARPYDYNRSGVVFAPGDMQLSRTNNLIAQVMEGSPAYEAGIRNGDTLLKLNQEWCTNWTQLTAAVFRKHGTRVDVTLKRGDQAYDTTVVLRDIFPSSANPTTKD
jgi:hypothetical protein